MGALYFTLTHDDGIKIVLKDWVNEFNQPDFIKSDPIKIPHRYHNRANIEISAFVTAWISYGNRKAIIKTADYIDREIFNGKPYRYIMCKSQEWKEFKGNKTVLYRFFTYADFFELCERLHTVYSLYDDMESYVLSVMDELNVIPLTALQASFGMVNGIPNDESKSACKRLCMFLRWMVRKDGIVDLGAWKRISEKDLIIPLDTHVHKVSRALGITKRKQADMTTAKEITDYFKTIFPDDPALGDYALFGAGLNHKTAKL